MIPSPVVASVSICKINRQAAQTLRALHSRYVITFHPKGIFTFMSSRYKSTRTRTHVCSQGEIHSSRLLIRQSRGVALDDDADMALR